MSYGRAIVRVLWLAVMLQTPSPLVGQLPQKPEAPTRSLSESDLQYYKDVPTMVEVPAKNLKSYPDFHKLVIADDPDRLIQILARTGQRVEEFFRTFPNTTCEERIAEERPVHSAFLVARAAEKFHYLLLSHLGGNDATLREFRTDKEGQEVDADPKGPFPRTHGFASTPIHFHPSYQEGERFRYLGRAQINKREADVVVFAQRPENVKIVNEFSAAERTAALLVQGIAWIDSETFQILRMDTFLLAKRPDFGLTALNTSIVFEEVHFQDSPDIAWLPQKVKVDILWRSNHFRNVHEYSDFKLFRSKSAIH